MKTLQKINKQTYFALLICLLFFIAYGVLSIIRYNDYGAFGFDLGLRDQTFWQYSNFKVPITTIHFYPFTSILTDHVELIYIPLSSVYWIWSDARTVLLLEPFLVCLSGIAIFLLAKEKKLISPICFALLISYLAFYGVQNAVWFDVHSVSFATSFMAWLVYFLSKNKTRWIVLSFFAAMLSKENIASLTFLIGLVWFIKTKRKIALFIMLTSVVYLFLIFGIYYPHLVTGYRYSNSAGILSNISNLSSFYDTQDKKEVIFYTLSWFGFIPLLNPLFLIPATGDLFNYFVVASQLKSAQGLFMHYRITLAPLMLWATIFTIAKYKFLNNKYVALYLFFCIIIIQYMLHLPLSYLVKSWFWTEPSGVKYINQTLKYLPRNASVVSQNNITPHISQRDRIFTLWPEKKDFLSNSPCKIKTCDWFRWVDDPEYLIVDTSKEWDIRHLLTNRNDYINGLANIEKKGIVKRYKVYGSAILYKVVKNPQN